MQNNVYENATPDETLRKKLIHLFNSWTTAPDKQEELADQILGKIVLRDNLDRLFTEDLSPAEHLGKLNDYISAIKNLRKTWLALPKSSRDLLPQFISDVEGCLLPSEVTRNLSSIFYSEKSELPEWRKTGMNNLEHWSCDLELIDLMRGTAEFYKENHMRTSGTRHSFHIGLIGEIATTCRAHNVSVSHSSRSHFVQIINLVLPNLSDPRASITKATGK
ncbi:hypothetical protein [Pseudomonas sp. LB3P25]